MGNLLKKKPRRVYKNLRKSVDGLKESQESQETSITEAEAAEVVVGKEETFAKLRTLEDSVCNDSLNIMDGVLAFADISPEAEGPPDEWVDEMGYMMALKRFRLARYGMMGAKEAPIGIKVAATIASNLIKAKGSEGHVGPLNVQAVQVVNNYNYKTMEIEE